MGSVKRRDRSPGNETSEVIPSNIITEQRGVEAQGITGGRKGRESVLSSLYRLPFLPHSLFSLPMPLCDQIKDTSTHQEVPPIHLTKQDKLPDKEVVGRTNPSVIPICPNANKCSKLKVKKRGMILNLIPELPFTLQAPKPQFFLLPKSKSEEIKTDRTKKKGTETPQIPSLTNEPLILLHVLHPPPNLDPRLGPHVPLYLEEVLPQRCKAP